MTIHIIDDSPDIYLSRGDYARYRQEYERAMMFYAGPHITFEEWVRQRMTHVTLSNGTANPL